MWSLIGLPAGAQFQQYTPPGTLSDHGPSRQVQLEGALEEALWRAGALRIQPWVGVKDVAYIDNVYATNQDTVSDFTATVGAGLRFFVPFGGKTIFAAHGQPEYVWWADLEDRRRWNGRYGAGIFGYYNRLEVWLSAARNDQSAVVTPEVEQRVSTRNDALHLGLDLQMVRSLYLLSRVSHLEYRSLETTDSGPLADYELNDRDEDVAQLGIELKPGDSFEVALMAEYSEAQFESAFDRSNSGFAPVLDLRYRGPLLYLEAQVAWRDLEPEGPTSTFIPFSDVTGVAEIGLDASESWRWGLYTRRNLVYSIQNVEGYFLEQAYGSSFGLPLGRRFEASVFYERGDHAYPSVAGGELTRDDEQTSWGGALSFNLGYGATLVFEGGERDLDSNIEGFSSQISYLGFTFRLGEIGWP